MDYQVDVLAKFITTAEFAGGLPGSRRFDPPGLHPHHKAGMRVTRGGGFEFAAFRYESDRPCTPYRQNYLN